MYLSMYLRVKRFNSRAIASAVLGSPSCSRKSLTHSDLVAECAKRKRPDQFIVGFALEEPSKLRERALEKLKRKGLDAIVANPLETMGSDSIEARIFSINRTAAFETTHFSSSAKHRFAHQLVDWIETTRLTIT